MFAFLIIYFLQIFLRIKSFILLPATLKMDIKPSDALPECICRRVYPVDFINIQTRVNIEEQSS